MTPWQLSWEGRTYTDEDLTVGHALVIGAQLGYGWAELSPWRGLLHLVTFLAVFESVALSRPYAEVVASLNEQPLVRVMAALTQP